MQEIFDSTDIKVEIIEGQSIFERDYPCFAAVNRASTGKIQLHHKIYSFKYIEIFNRGKAPRPNHQALVHF